LRLEEPDGQHLAGVVPLVESMVGVEALIALEADEGFLEHRRQHLGDLGLPDACLTLEKQGPSQLQSQVHRHRQAAIGYVVARSEGFADLID